MNSFQYLWSMLFSFGPALYIAFTYKWWWGVVAFIAIMIGSGLFSWIMLTTLGSNGLTIRGYLKWPIVGFGTVLIAHYLWT